MGGDVAAALARLKELYNVGADPVVVLEDLATFTHAVTRLKLAASAVDDDALTEEEKARGRDLADKLTLRALARAWQMLLKGIDEARPPRARSPPPTWWWCASPMPPSCRRPTRRCARCATSVASRGPAPPIPRRAARAARLMAAGGGARAAFEGAPLPSARAAPVASASAAARLQSWAGVVALAGEHRELRLKHALETTVRPIRFEPGRIEVELTADAPSSLVQELSRRLEEWTGERWMIAVGRDGGAPTVAEVRKAAEARMIDDARADPLVARRHGAVSRRRDRGRTRARQ